MRKIDNVPVLLIAADYVVDLYILLGRRETFYKAGREMFFEILKYHKSMLLKDVLSFLFKSGWGNFKLVWYSENRIIIKGISVFAEQLRKYYGIQKHPVDDFIVGVLDAWADKRKLKLEFREIECVGMGNNRCIFVGEFIKRPKHYLVELQQNLKGEII